MKEIYFCVVFDFKDVVFALSNVTEESYCNIFIVIPEITNKTRNSKRLTKIKILPHNCRDTLDNILFKKDKLDNMINIYTVSYTHLTLPTKRIV